MMTLGSTLLTVDAPSVFFWVLAMIAGWWAISGGLENRTRSSPSPRLGYWALAGLCLGLGLLSKYTAIVQVISFAIFLVAWKPARKHLREAGPYMALGIALLAFVP